MEFASQLVQLGRFLGPFHSPAVLSHRSILLMPQCSPYPGLRMKVQARPCGPPCATRKSRLCVLLRSIGYDEAACQDL
jgi:hypothetical protein